MSSTGALHLFAAAAFVAVIFQLHTRLLELVLAAAEVLCCLLLLLLLLLPLLPLSLLTPLFSAWSRPPPGIQGLLTVTGRFVFWAASCLFFATRSGLRCVRTFPEFVDRLLRQEELRSLLERELSTLQARYEKQKQALASLSHDIFAVCKESDIFCREFPAEMCYRRRHGMPAATIRDTEWAEPQLWIKMCKCFIFYVYFRPSFVASPASPVHRLLPSRRTRRLQGNSLLFPRPSPLCLRSHHVSPLFLVCFSDLRLDHHLTCVFFFSFRAVYATDLKAVFLSGKVKQLRSAVLTNDDRIRHLSTALKKERQMFLDLAKKYNDLKERKRREEAEAIRYRREQKRAESWRPSKSTPARLRSVLLTDMCVVVHIVEEARDAQLRNRLHLAQLRDRVRLPDPVPRPVVSGPCNLPLHAARRAAEKASRALAICQPDVAPLPALVSSFDALFGCPQEALVPFSAPASETTALQQIVSPPAV